jgi:dTMP kinase
MFAEPLPAYAWFASFWVFRVSDHPWQWHRAMASGAAAAAAKRGVFILVEGLDRCGKTTQTKRLHDYLNAAGQVTQQIGFPDRTTPTGILINQHLTKQTKVLDLSALNLLFSSNRWERKSFIEDALRAGTNLVCDRYSFSGLAYSIANVRVVIVTCHTVEAVEPGQKS